MCDNFPNEEQREKELKKIVKIIDSSITTENLQRLLDGEKRITPKLSNPTTKTGQKRKKKTKQHQKKLTTELLNEEQGEKELKKIMRIIDSSITTENLRKYLEKEEHIDKQ